MQLTEMLSPRTDPHLWGLVKQCGVNDIVALLDGGEQDRRMFGSVGSGGADHGAGDGVPWSEASIARDQARFAGAGFGVSAIEDTPPLDLARLGLAGRDEQIEHVIRQIQAMGELGIPTLCYNWMAVSSWARTSVDIRSRGGALVTGYRAADESALAPFDVEQDAEQLWAALAYFLEAVVPVAEQAGVRLALHPDDPPVPVVRGIPRIMSSVDAFRRVLDLVVSPANAITLCQGNFALMTSDLPSVIREFGRRDAIAFVHFRDVRGTADDFVETFHDAGQSDLLACVRAYDEVGFTGAVRPDHVPTMFGEANERPGYGTLGRLFALGYIRGLQRAVASA